MGVSERVIVRVRVRVVRADAWQHHLRQVGILYVVGAISLLYSTVTGSVRVVASLCVKGVLQG